MLVGARAHARFWGLTDLGPFSLFDGGVEPLIPPRFALFRSLTNEQRRYTRPIENTFSERNSKTAVETRVDAPLVLAVLRNGSLEHFVFGVLPYTTFDKNADHGDLFVRGSVGAESTQSTTLVSCPQPISILLYHYESWWIPWWWW